MLEQCFYNHGCCVLPMGLRVKQVGDFYNDGDVCVSFIGNFEFHSTLSLWLGWMTYYYGTCSSALITLFYINLHSVGIIILVGIH
jgi:hypothetical protein